MGGKIATRAHTRAEMSNDDFAAAYRNGLAHLVGIFRAKGIGVEESRDLAHETVVRTLVHLKRHGRTQEDIGPLTRTIARNLMVERLRKAGPAVLPLSDEMDAADDTPGPSELALQTERREAVRDAMRSLTPRHRKVIELWMQGRSPAEIARTLGIKRNAADAILHRARRTLASRLGPRSLWGAVVLAWLRLKHEAKHAGSQLAAWSPDSASMAPAGVAMATFGLVAAMSLSGGPAVTHAVPRSAPAVTLQVEKAVPVAKEVAVTRSSAPVMAAADVAPVEGARRPTKHDIGVAVGGRQRGADGKGLGAGIRIEDDGQDEDVLTVLRRRLTTVPR